ncbi:sensor histidine kinase [Paenibacillus chungangensis]|uniref:histidine kinase n=1 Tax=Paenibacillus chungangensis TaxID=696535 RepID=A0ABW3HLH2_9BACL
MLRFFRRMNVLLFMTFFLFSLVFILLLSTVYNFHWDSLFDTYQESLLDSSSYRLIDDMRAAGIGRGEPDEADQAWIKRRANLYGILIQYTSVEGDVLWLDTIGNFDSGYLEEVREYAYVISGETVGVLRTANLVSRNKLNPATIEYQEQLAFRSRIMYASIIIVSLLFSLWIAKALSKHLVQLTDQTNLIRMGRRDLVIPVRGPEEVRRLAVTLEEMVKELKKQEDWRQHLMEDLTHELRTPLTSMLTQLEAIQDGVYEADGTRMQEIYEELERLSRLINDLERLSEAESAKFSLHIRRTDMMRLARRVFENFQSLARSKDIKLTFESTHVPCFCEIDRDKFVQVISNLLFNAIKYNQPGGTVCLRVICHAEYTDIQCEDTGIGINDEDLPYVFNRLYRSDKSRSRFNSGVGLGLSIVKALVEAHNGEVYAVSELGRGSVFTVRIPNVFMSPGDEAERAVDAGH